MEWKKLLTQARLIEDKEDPKAFNDYYISPFERDYEKIVSSAVFRRLQDKTQVFPLAKSDFVRTRLTHSIEVSTIAKQLGIMCFQNTSAYVLLPIDKDEEHSENLKMKRNGDIEAILSCAGLLHDIGNPPFGHVGESIIREWFEKNLKGDSPLKCHNGTPVYDELNDKMMNDLLNFEGNAQAFRIMAKAQYKSEINLPFSILSSMVKYPTRSHEINRKITIRKKIGCYQAEESSFIQIATEVGTITKDGAIIRHPLSYLVEAADDIAYGTADLEDAVNSGVVSVDELLTFFLSRYQELGIKNDETPQHIDRTKEVIDELDLLNKNEEDKTKVMEQWSTYLRKWLMYVVCWRFSKDYTNILKGNFTKDLFHDTNHSLTIELLKEAMAKLVFNSRVIIEPEVSAQTILNFLLDKFVPVMVQFEDNEKMTAQERNILNLIPSNYINDYFESKNINCHIMDKAELLYRRILVATDFISSMTDGYAKNLYKKMSGI